MVYRLVITPEQIKENQITLDAQQLHYLLRVLRLGNGDRFIALDGTGNTWLTEIREQSARIIESIEVTTELPVSLTLITALPKGNGYEQVLRCCTELGVSNFMPVISDRTLLKPSASKVQRWRKIVTEAAEQSERQIVPHIDQPTKFMAAVSQETINQDTINQDKYICVARGELPNLVSALAELQLQHSQPKTPSEIIIATGCEGGWTNREIDQAIACGFQPVSLGNRILRAITAPIAASSIVTAVLDTTWKFI